MVEQAVRQLLATPGSDRSWIGRGRALVSADDLDAKPEAISTAREHVRDNDLAAALSLAEQHLNGERRNDALRRIIFDLVLQPGNLADTLTILERRLPHNPRAVVHASLYLLACHHQGKEPRLDLMSALVWTAAMRWLFDYGTPEVLAAISAAIVACHPDQRFLARLHGAASLVPPAVPGDRFIDRLDACAQLVRHGGPAPAGLLVCFCGFHGRMGIPLNFIQRWAARAGFHVLYLRDLAQSHYRHGLKPFGTSFDDTVAAIGEIATDLGAGRIALYGSSMGGIVAIRAGHALGAPRVLSAAGTVDVGARDGVPLSEEEKIATTREQSVALAAELRASRTATRTIYLYGEAHARDAVMAAALHGVDSVETMALDDLNRHNIDFHLVMTGRYHNVFDWLAGRRDDLALIG